MELGDTMGLTPVPIKRVLMEFRKRGLISMDRKMMNLLDVEELQALAGFLS